jgi:hypothetical protein
MGFFAYVIGALKAFVKPCRHQRCSSPTSAL